MTTTYLLDDVGTYLAGAGLGLVEGTNLYLGYLKDNPDSCLALFEYDGMAPMYTMGPQSLPAIAQPHLQIVWRDVGYVQARTGAESVTRALEQVTNQNVNGTYYERIERLQDPFFMQRDTVKYRVYFACNFGIMRTPT
jgi:hypothetical protein